MIRRLPGPRAAPAVLALALLAVASAAASAQDARPAGPVSPDSADAIRATLVRPRAKPPADAVDVVTVPFRVAVFPLRLLGKGGAGLVAFMARALRPRENSLLKRLSDAGLRPRFGSIGPRSGAAAGVKFVRWSPFFVQTEYSVRRSQRHEVGLEFGGQSYSLAGSYTFARHAQPHFWGIGPNTKNGDRVDYLWDRQIVGVAAAIAASRWTFGGRVAYEDNRVGRGFDGERPDIQDLPRVDTLFGVRERTRYLAYNLSAALDHTRRRGFQRRGYMLELRGVLYRGARRTDSDFHRLRGVATGYVPANARQALAVRGIVEVNDSDGGRGVPFTHLASLGNWNGGRAYHSGRYRDLAMAAAMAEWRYEVWRELHERGRVESFLLIDSGAVGHRLGDIGVEDLRWSFGFGMRLVWAARARGNAVLAFGRDGPRFSMRFRAVY